MWLGRAANSGRHLRFVSRVPIIRRLPPRAQSSGYLSSGLALGLARSGSRVGRRAGFLTVARNLAIYRIGAHVALGIFDAAGTVGQYESYVQAKFPTGCRLFYRSS